MSSIIAHLEGPYLILTRLGVREELYLPSFLSRDLTDAMRRLESLFEPDPRIRVEGVYGYAEIKNPDQL